MCADHRPCKQMPAPGRRGLKMRQSAPSLIQASRRSGIGTVARRIPCPGNVGGPKEPLWRPGFAPAALVESGFPHESPRDARKRATMIPLLSVMPVIHCGSSL